MKKSIIYVNGQQVTLKNNKPFNGFEDIDVYIGEYWEKRDPGNGPDAHPSVVQIKLTHPVTDKEVIEKVYRHMLMAPPPPPTPEEVEHKFSVTGYMIPRELEWCWYGKWVIQVQKGNALTAPAWVLEPIEGSEEAEVAEEVLPDIAPPEDEKTFCLGCSKVHDKAMIKLPKDCTVIREQKYYMLFKSTRSWDELRELMASVGTVGIWNEEREADEVKEDSLEVSLESATVVTEVEGGKPLKVTIGDAKTHKSLEEKETALQEKV